MRRLPGIALALFGVTMLALVVGFTFAEEHQWSVYTPIATYKTGWADQITILAGATAIYLYGCVALWWWFVEREVK